LASYIDTDARIIQDDYKYFILCAENISTGLSDTIEIKKT